MALIPAKEFLARFKNRKPKPTPAENESDRYYDAMGEIIEQYPIIPRHIRLRGKSET